MRIEKLDSYSYLVFGGVLQSSISPTTIRDILNGLTRENKLLGAQLFDHRLIWGYRHIHSALWHAEKAKKSESMISKTLAMEILLYTAGCRQIKKAIELVGIQEDTNKIICVLLANTETPLSESYLIVKEKLQLQSDLTVIENFSEKKEAVKKYLKDEGYKNVNHFSNEEIEKIFLQKVALLSLEN